MNIYEFMDNNWFLTTMLALPVFLIMVLSIWLTGRIIISVLFRLPIRTLRCISVMFRGWPPTHCDADGDSIIGQELDKAIDKAVEKIKSALKGKDPED